MKNIYAGIALLLVVQLSFGQVSPTYQKMQENELLSHKTMLGAENQTDWVGLDYDVKYYRIEIRLNPDSAGPVAAPGKYVRGVITTYFTTNISNFNLIKFDFATALICDSVYHNGVKLAAGNKAEVVDTLKITIPTITTIGTLDSIKVYYQGLPPVVTDFGGSTGFVKGTHSSGNYLYSLSEPYSAFTWWPCKARVASDKADSVDMIISTPSTFRVAANGKRISEAVNGANRLTIWQHRYPISSYQIAISAANFVQYPTTPTIVNIGGTNMELYNLLWNGTNTAAAQTALNRTGEMLSVFSNQFSDYPYKNEKYGHYTFGFGGGMEHNTFSGMGTGTYDAAGDWSVIAHELAHQWWGAAVTCGSWRDIWVNEGFARYSEILYLEGKTDPSITITASAQRRAYKTTSFNYNAKPIYQADTSTMTVIFSPSQYIYERGAMFISMLRKTVGDAKFFQALKNYQTDPTLQHGNAFTDDVKRHMEAISGLDLTEMFTDWVYKTGHASYTNARWNNSGTEVVIMLPQTTVTSNISHFDMPVVLRFNKTTAPVRDTTMVFFDRGGVLYRVDSDGIHSSSSGGSVIQVTLPFVPNTISFDAASETLARPDVGASPTFTPALITKDPALTLLATKIVNFTAQKENKNARLSWSIDQSFDYSAFEIERSIDGTIFEKIGTQTAAQLNGARNFVFTDFNLPAGFVYYRIRIIEKNGSSFYTKIATLNNKFSESFVLSPNPATDHIMVSHGAATTLLINVKVLDGAGRIVKTISRQSVAPGAKLRLPLQDLTNGTYYVELEGNDYFKVVKKIVLTK